MPKNRRIACYLSDKKFKKINWTELNQICSKYGFEIFKLDLNESLESQEPFCVILHKLVDVISQSDLGDIKNVDIINKLETYINDHPQLVIMDPLPNVRNILNRFTTYNILKSTNFNKCNIFIPNYCQLTSCDPKTIKENLKQHEVTYPFVCKPILSHGPQLEAHQMILIFDENGLQDVKIPCVAQSFINHDAVLYKVFILGESHMVSERPSIKNLYITSKDVKSIFFNTAEVSKTDSKSQLCVMDPSEKINSDFEPDNKIFEIMAKTIRSAYGMDLLGVDVVVEKSTGRYGIIDVNSYPGYEGFPNSYDHLLKCIIQKCDEKLK